MAAGGSRELGSALVLLLLLAVIKLIGPSMPAGQQPASSHAAASAWQLSLAHSSDGWRKMNVSWVTPSPLAGSIVQ